MLVISSYYILASTFLVFPIFMAVFLLLYLDPQSSYTQADLSIFFFCLFQLTNYDGNCQKRRDFHNKTIVQILCRVYIQAPTTRMHQFSRCACFFLGLVSVVPLVCIQHSNCLCPDDSQVIFSSLFI